LGKTNVLWRVAEWDMLPVGVLSTTVKPLGYYDRAQFVVNLDTNLDMKSFVARQGPDGGSISRQRDRPGGRCCLSAPMASEPPRTSKKMCVGGCWFLRWRCAR